MIGSLISENTKVGLIISGFGIFYLSLGCAMLFDGALLALGNICVCIGLTITFGVRNLRWIFFSRSKLPGTICFFVGMYCVLTKWPRIGIIVEFIGIVNLFARFLPGLSFLLWIVGCIPFVGPRISRLWG